MPSEKRVSRMGTRGEENRYHQQTSFMAKTVSSLQSKPFSPPSTAFFAKNLAFMGLLIGALNLYLRGAKQQ